MSLLLLGFKIALGTVANLEKTETYTLQAKITNELYCGPLSTLNKIIKNAKIGQFDKF